MIEYNGEHLLIGQIGMFLTLLAFFSALLSAYANIKAANSIDVLSEKPWQKLARTTYIINAIAVLSLFITLYLIIKYYTFNLTKRIY